MKSNHFFKLFFALCTALSLIGHEAYSQETSNQFSASTTSDNTWPMYSINTGQNEQVILHQARNNASWIPAGAQNDFFYITKLDASGNQIFNKSINFNDPTNNAFICVSGLVETSNQEFLIAGYYNDNLSSGPGTSAIGIGTFLMRVDVNGNFMWVKFYKSSSSFFLPPQVGHDRIALTTHQSGNSYFLASSATSPIGQEVGINVMHLDNNGNIIWDKTYYDVTPNTGDYYDQISSLTYRPKDIVFSSSTGNYVIGGHVRIAHIKTDSKLFFLEIDDQGNVVTDITWYGNHFSQLYMGQMIYDDNLNNIVFSHKSQKIPSFLFNSGIHSISGLTSMDVAFNMNFEKRYFATYELINHSLSQRNNGGFNLGNKSVIYDPNNSTWTSYPSMIETDAGGDVTDFDYFNHDENNLSFHTYNSQTNVTSFVAGVNSNFIGSSTISDDFVNMNFTQQSGTCSALPHPISQFDDPQLVVQRMSNQISPTVEEFYPLLNMDIPLVVLNLCPPCPQVSITGLNTICTGDVAVLDANPANLPGYTYTWSPGGFVGSTFNTGPLTSTTTFTVTMTDGICTSTATHTVNVTPLTIPTFSQVGPYCPGSTIPPLPTTSLNGITGTWSPAMNNSATTTYTFTPAPGQCADPTSLTIAIDPCCLNLDFCFNIDNRKLTFASITPNTNPSPCTHRYKWIWGDGTSTAFTTSANTAKNQTKTYTNEGTYTVCLVVEKLCNGVVVCCQQVCKEIKTVPLCDATRINAELGLSIVNTPNGTIVTPIRGTAFKSLTGTQLSINFGTPMLPNYNVATGANTFSTAPAAVTYTVPGTYEYCVTLTYTNAFGDQCIDKRCKTIVIEPWCATQAHFRYSSCAQSNSFNFTPIGNAAGTQVFWDFGDGTNGNSIGNTPINKIFANPGVYQVCMTVVNGKCESQACYTIIVNQSVVSNCMPQNLMLSSNPNEVTEMDDIPLEHILLPSNEDSDISSLVYPNPATGIVHVLISTGSEKEAKIELRTLEGRLIQSTMKSVNQENSKETMDVSGLESGIYIISIEIDGQIVSHKIMVNN